MLAVPFHIQMRQRLESQRVQVAVQRRTNMRKFKAASSETSHLGQGLLLRCIQWPPLLSLFHEDFKPVKLGDAALTRNTAGAQRPSAADDV